MIVYFFLLLILISGFYHSTVKKQKQKKKFLNFLFLLILSFVYFSKNKNRPSNAAVSFISITSLNGGSLLLLNGGL